jgi:hypothetical protein
MVLVGGDLAYLYASGDEEKSPGLMRVEQANGDNRENQNP